MQLHSLLASVRSQPNGHWPEAERWGLHDLLGAALRDWPWMPDWRRQAVLDEAEFHYRRIELAALNAKAGQLMDLSD